MNIADYIFGCRYPGFFGYVLASFQYLPTIILFVVFIWTIIYRNYFYSSLSLCMKSTYIFSIILKYVYFPIFDNTLSHDGTCDGIVIRLINSILSFVYNENVDKLLISYFPNPDVVQIGSFIGFIVFSHFWWKYKISKIMFITLILSFIVPWSYIAGSDIHPIIVIISLLFGIILGVLFLIMFYFIFEISIISNMKHSKFFIYLFGNINEQSN